MMRHAVVVALSMFLLGSWALAGEKVKIPKVVDQEVVGEWKVVKMGLDGKLEPVPEDRPIRFIFNADGKGAQFKGERKKEILWGADKEGVFAAQWDQPEGNGDAIAGSWAITVEGLQLDVAEYGDGEGPPEETFTLLLKRVDG